MWETPLALLPDSYLSHSVITTVWVGILVIGFFNLRFGWIFSGLVVPGYLTPLLLIKPLSVGVILLESVMTYGLVYLLSEVAGRRGLWTNLFGRDRFFAILLLSVVVRIFFDGWALPWVSDYALRHYHVNLDYQDSLHSFGLIIVALIANQLWKPRLFHGLIQLIVTVGITYLIVRYLLVAYTNFSLSNIGYMYEDVAGSILASPKSYIILILAAFIASRMNLFYGWDFNGILVPSLLALQWYQPLKILLSFGEAYLILFLATHILKLPLIKNMSIEGARKVLLFFNIGFFYKIGLSIVIVYFLPDYKVSDYFAFGYLLSTLIAVKMYDKVNMALFTRTTLQTSLVAIVFASTIGYGLTQLADQDLFYSPPASSHSTRTLYESNATLIDYLVKEKPTLYRPNRLLPQPTPQSLRLFRKLLALATEDFERYRTRISHLLATLGYRATHLEGHYLLLQPLFEHTAWGLYLIDLSTQSSLLLEVPQPLESGDLVESAIILMEYTHAKAMALSPTAMKLEGEMLHQEHNTYHSFYHTFHQFFAKEGVVQLRRLGKKQYYALTQQHREHRESLLLIQGYIPKGLKVATLQKALGQLRLLWNTPSDFSLQKSTMSSGFATLYLSRLDRQKLIASYPYTPQHSGIHKSGVVDSIKGVLQRWILEKKIILAHKASEQYHKPTLQELLFFDHSILTPLLQRLDQWQPTPPSEAEMMASLQSIALDAQAMGYHLTLHYDTFQKRYYLILVECEGKVKRYWGTYIFGVGAVNRIMIQAPHPFYEANTFEYATELLEQLNAKALLLSGAHPLSNSDRSADVMRFANRKSLFNLVSQVLFRESGEVAMHALQIRGMGEVTGEDKHTAVLAFSHTIEHIEQLPPLQQTIYRLLKQYLPLTINDGNYYSAGFDTNAIQALYLDQSFNNTFSTLWLPPELRSKYRQQKRGNVRIEPFEVLGVAVDTVDSRALLCTYTRPQTPLDRATQEQILSQVTHYLDTKDIVELAGLQRRKELVMSVVIDHKNSQPFLLLLTPQEELIAAVKLNSTPPYQIQRVGCRTSLPEAIEEFYFNHFDMLLLEAPCDE